jgi:hypothetical protein
MAGVPAPGATVGMGTTPTQSQAGALADPSGIRAALTSPIPCVPMQATFDRRRRARPRVGRTNPSRGSLTGCPTAGYRRVCHAGPRAAMHVLAPQQMADLQR